MKAMTISRKEVTRFVTGKMLAITIAGMLVLPVAAFSQQPEEGGEDQQVETPSSTNSGPWQNSAGSTIGTRDNNAAGSAARPAADPRLGPGGGSLSRPAAPLAGGPGGNPDVPFDSNMNLAFLAAGLVFAFTVVRKRLRLRTVTVENK